MGIDGTSYRYYHSSFGFGWRRCQPMDCVQELRSDGVVDDGCTPARTRPIVCVEIAEDGTEPALLDTFEKCLGDPDAP